MGQYKITLKEKHFWNANVRISENLLLHKMNENPGENSQNQLFYHSKN